MGRFYFCCEYLTISLFLVFTPTWVCEVASFGSEVWGMSPSDGQIFPGLPCCCKCYFSPPGELLVDVFESECEFGSCARSQQGSSAFRTKRIPSPTSFGPCRIGTCSEHEMGVEH